MKQTEAIKYLDQMAGQARMLGRLYEEMAETVAGFASEEEYQAAAVETFQTEQELADELDSCRLDAS